MEVPGGLGERVWSIILSPLLLDNTTTKNLIVDFRRLYTVVLGMKGYGREVCVTPAVEYEKRR